MAMAGVDVPNPDFGELQKLLSNQRKISDEINKQLVKFEELQEAVSEQAKISNEIDRAVLGEKAVMAMMQVVPEKVRGVLSTLSKKIIQQGKTPVLVLTTTNASSVKKMLVESRIDFEKIMLIDCVTRNVLNSKNTKSVLFVDSLRNLTQLQIKVINVFEKNNNSVFVFDSLDALELYHDNETIFKFVHSVTKILRQRKLSGNFIFADRGRVRQLSQFFDSLIEIK